MEIHELTVEVRDRNLNRVGTILPEELALDLEDAHNNVGTWELTLAPEHPLADALRTPGSGIIVTGPDGVLMSGPMTVPMQEIRSSDPGGMLTIAGVSDSIILADYRAFPDPANADAATQSRTHDIRTGAAETVMHQYVAANIGPLAPASRRKANLVMGTDLGRGPLVTKAARWPVLGTVLDEIAVMANLGFRVVQRGTSLVFETFQVRDRSPLIRLDVHTGTLLSQKVALSPPGVTRVFVAGKTVDTDEDTDDRQMIAATSEEALAAEAEWGRRIERFVDQRQTDDPLIQQQKADEVLAAEGFTGVNVQVVPMDDATMRFPTDWYLGDTVAVVVDNGEAKSLVSGFALRVDNAGVRLGVLLGKAKEFDSSASQQGRLSDVERRVSYLEQSGAGSGGSAPGSSSDNDVYNYMGVF